jgi:SAM-dependent methyltransferase
MSDVKPYNNNFYQSQREGSLRSAEEIVPLIIKIINPQSVIDVGCGMGTWLSVFKKLGVEDIQGVDGDWGPRQMLKISNNQFLPFDMTKPLRLGRQFDLVMSLEVAEHLPERCAKQFVDSLTGLGAVVLFSAAIPLQGGAEHQNEQWPDYWAKLFLENNYEVIDCLRKHIWNNNKITYWYSQNILLFINKVFLENNKLLKQEFEQTNINMLSLVHPKHYLTALDIKKFTLKEILYILPQALLKSIDYRIRKLSKYVKSQPPLS